VGVDWPLSERDLEPHYEFLEGLLEVVGPGDVPPEHNYLKTQRVRSPGEVVECARKHLAPAFAVYPTRRAEYPAGPLLPMTESAAATGRLVLREGAVARSVVTDRTGEHAVGVEFVDAESRNRELARGRTVVLAASALETVRLLLCSDARHRGGLGNSSGLLGRFLMDHIHTRAVARATHVPDFRDGDASYLAQPARLGERAFYIPPAHEPSREKGFVGRYQIEGTVYARRRVELAACGEMLPRRENRMTLHPEKKDRFGSPLAHIDVRFGENDRRMIEQQRHSLTRILECLGASRPRVFEPVPGDAIHEAGGARMGDNPGESVVDRNGRLWDVPNVWIADGAVLPSIGFQNPTLTILALARRAAEHLLREHVKTRR
jgi:choline dehydrogenase-like flavoprotein